MRRTGLFLMLMLAMTTSLLTEDRDSLLNKLLSAWEIYGNYPTVDNAQGLIDALPDSVVDYSLPLYESVLESETFRKLEINAFAGERTAVRVLFRMLNVSDGAAGEFLSIELGLLLRVNPGVFLEELKKNRMFVPDLGPFVGNNDAMEYERIKRIKAVESVVDKELAAVKAECLRELERMKYPPED